ncbi:carbon-nitrogen hydrolase family protein [Saccharopolyspora phatthalungensis]|uniref:carbon-nitrogen hydrolase family protein n=1 Tax=Saccharopolyspora phatthalungensis TaxID=664693 RepID=UPI0035E42AA8
MRGARIIVCASAFLSPRLDHWEFFIRARAAENQVFVVASGQVGTEPVSGIGFVGRSMIADPGAPSSPQPRTSRESSPHTST